MSDNYVDPSGNTEAFRAFTQNELQEPAASSKTPLIAGIVAGVVLLAAVIIWITAG